MISSAQESDSQAARILSSSLKVIVVAEIFIKVRSDNAIARYRAYLSNRKSESANGNWLRARAQGFQPPRCWPAVWMMWRVGDLQELCCNRFQPAVPNYAHWSEHSGAEIRETSLIVPPDKGAARPQAGVQRSLVLLALTTHAGEQ